MREIADLSGEVMTMRARAEWIQNRMNELFLAVARLDHQQEN